MVEAGSSWAATASEKFVKPFTMLPGHWLVNQFEETIEIVDNSPDHLSGLHKTCGLELPAESLAKAHSQIRSESLFKCRLSILTTRH